MNGILATVDAWLLAVVLAAAMLAAWYGGQWWGRRRAKAGPPAEGGKFPDASVALLGLLLAFTFSMSLAKHDQRRLEVVNDSNAIGDFYTCASLVKEPVRGKLRAVIRTYVEHRLALTTDSPDEATLEKRLGEVGDLQNQMLTLVGEAVDGGTPLAVPLTNTLNELTSSHASRLAAYRDRLPLTIVVLLYLAALVSMLLMGNNQGASGERRTGAVVAFVVLVTITVWVTLDLNQPQRGLITVSQEPMQRLLSGMQ